MDDPIMTEEATVVSKEPLTEQGSVRRARAVGLGVAAFVGLIGYRHGGYELPITGEITLLVSWALLLGAALGLVPRVRLTGARAWAVALLTGFLGWSVLSVLWSDAAGRSVASGVQIAAVLSVLLLASLVVTVKDREAVLAGLLGGISVVAALAVGSRLHPAWFPSADAVGELGRLRPRLYWPVGYWNALAYLCGMVLPLAVHFSGSAKKGITRAAAGLAIPVLALAVLFAISRGGLAVALFAVTLGFLLGPITVRTTVNLVSALVTSGVVVLAALAGNALMDGVTDSGLGATQATTALLVLIAAAMAMATVAATINQLPGGHSGEDRNPAHPWLRLVIALAFVATLTGSFFAAGGGSTADRAWNDFRNPSLSVDRSRINSVDRLAAQSSNGRWQLWQGAINAGSEKPLRGTGAGTYELWWTQHRKDNLSVRNAHSLYLEAWADLGLVGLLLILGFVSALAIACVTALRRAGKELGLVAAGTSTVAAFAISSAVDWGWQVTVLPIVAMLAFVATTAPEAPTLSPAPRFSRFGFGAMAFALIALVLPPTVASNQLASSRDQARNGHLNAALADAQSAKRWQPYSAGPWLQAAQIQESRGKYGEAQKLLLGAIKREEGAWQPWLLLAGVEAHQGHTAAALRDYRRARDLNPTSQLFATGN
ncbi:MAG: O-antigen ligase family protein [Solirubrobacterales bacterium]|nr:O-antigen ligase family protein [Solirubrobacterales bacterium]